MQDGGRQSGRLALVLLPLYINVCAKKQVRPARFRLCDCGGGNEVSLDRPQAPQCCISTVQLYLIYSRTRGDFSLRVPSTAIAAACIFDYSHALNFFALLALSYVCK